MKYTKQEVMQFVEEEDVKFIRLAFCDVFGKQKNISIMPEELNRAFDGGIAIDAWSIEGFGGNVHSDLFLRPDPSTLAILPWRPEHGRVVRMFCNITWPDGSSFEGDSRAFLQRAVEAAKKAGCRFRFGSEQEFYLFENDEEGRPTKVPFDWAGYMDVSPEDKGEDVRREICMALEQMGIYPESSHHEEGPGQNEISFRSADALTAADNALTFSMAVRTIAGRNGIYADFSPKPLPACPGNGMHVNFSVKSTSGEELLQPAIAGIMAHIKEMTAFLNPSGMSYKRFGKDKAPAYISWSAENRSQLIRVPAAGEPFRRAELRSPDSMANPFIAYGLIIYAALDGIVNKMPLPEPVDKNLYMESEEELHGLERLPLSLKEAQGIAEKSEFIQKYLPDSIRMAYLQR